MSGEHLCLWQRVCSLSPAQVSLDHVFPDICQDTNQTLFKPCQGSEEVPCNKPVPVSLSEEPCCPLHLRLPPQMYVPEQVLAVPEELEAAPTDLYLSAAELQPTESLPLEFSDVSCAVRGVKATWPAEKHPRNTAVSVMGREVPVKSWWSGLQCSSPGALRVEHAWTSCKALPPRHRYRRTVFILWE